MDLLPNVEMTEEQPKEEEMPQEIENEIIEDIKETKPELTIEPEPQKEIFVRKKKTGPKPLANDVLIERARKLREKKQLKNKKLQENLDKIKPYKPPRDHSPPPQIIPTKEEDEDKISRLVEERLSKKLQQIEEEKERKRLEKQQKEEEKERKRLEKQQEKEELKRQLKKELLEEQRIQSLQEAKNRQTARSVLFTQEQYNQGGWNDIF